MKKAESNLKKVFDKLKKRIGYKKAIVALARKILTIVRHLVVTDEFYGEIGGVKMEGTPPLNS